MKATQLYEVFGKFSSVEEINMTATGLLEEGDIENLKVLAKENGLEDMVDLYTASAVEALTDSFMAAIGRLNVEATTEEIETASKEIPALPIIEYLQSKCDEPKVAQAIMRADKELIGCIAYIRGKAKESVTKNKPYLADMVVFQMAIDYYTK